MNGTADSDFIRCATVDAGDTVNGLGGNDYIITGPVNGTVLGGTGSDYVRTGANAGLVDGDDGFDYCVVASGSEPVNCEYPF
ncbi:hypothetical protein GCM10010271_39960 [Streptomyces kurssanovii]|nr:hypothetical protein GCM10010271_39960 [Streptomyces kurssanovii]